METAICPCQEPRRAARPSELIVLYILRVWNMEDEAPSCSASAASASVLVAATAPCLGFKPREVAPRGFSVIWGTSAESRTPFPLGTTCEAISSASLSRSFRVNSLRWTQVTMRRESSLIDRDATNLVLQPMGVARPLRKSCWIAKHKCLLPLVMTRLSEGRGLGSLDPSLSASEDSETRGAALELCWGCLGRGAVRVP